MSHEGGGPSPWMPLWWFLIIIVGLWVLWYFTGGPQRAERQGDKPYLKSLEPLDSGQPYNTNPTH